MGLASLKVKLKKKILECRKPKNFKKFKTVIFVTTIDKKIAESFELFESDSKLWHFERFGPIGLHVKENKNKKPRGLALCLTRWKTMTT